MSLRHQCTKHKMDASQHYYHTAMEGLISGGIYIVISSPIIRLQIVINQIKHSNIKASNN